MQSKSTFSVHPLVVAIALSFGSQPLYAAQSDEVPTEVQELAETKVEAAEEVAAHLVIEPQMMRRSLRSDLSEALSFLPSVRVDNTASSSTQQGDIKPAEFSIRGAAPYQNNLQLDNSPIDSLLDPAYKQQAGDSPSRTSVAGHSQSIFIDPNFLSSLEVIDSNASAKEGNFTGGVVKAKTRRYQGDTTFNFSHRMTKDSWTKFHIDEDVLVEFDEGAAQRVTGTPGEFQPIFDKSITSMSGTFRVGDIGYFIGYSERRSEIEQKRVGQLAIPDDMDYFLETGNVFKRGESDALDSKSQYLTVRADALGVPYDLYATFAYSKFYEDSFLINFLNSDFTNNIEGYNFAVNYGDDWGTTRVDSTLAINLSENQRDGQTNALDNFSGRNFHTQAAFIGSYGDLQSKQQTATASVDFVTPLTPAHDLAYGVEIKHVRLQQNRAQDYVESVYYPDDPSKLNGVGGVVPYEEHHLQREATYGAGEIAFNETNLAAYGEIDGSSGRFFYRAGGRLSRDAWLGNTNFAPRLFGGMFLNAEETLKLEVGANRYYGKSFLSYRLRDEEKKFVTIRERELSFDPSSPLRQFRGSDEWLASDLSTPYDNEYSFGLVSSNDSGTMGAQVVVREGRDQIRTDYNPDDKTYRYVNRGRTDTKQFDLFWRSPMYQAFAASWQVNTSASWMDSETDAQYLNGGYGGTADPREEVIFEGKRVLRLNLPADDFASPITANIDVLTFAFDKHLQLSNRFSYSNGYQYLRSTGTDTDSGLKTYEVEDQGSTFTWDLGMEYVWSTEGQTPYLRIDVVNVTNSSNVMRHDQGINLFGLGRQFWLEFGYRF